AETIVGFAFTRRERGAGTPLSIVSLVAVTALLAATLLTLASFDNLSRNRELAGATWDAAVSPPWNVDGSHADAALARVRAVPGVAAATIGGWAASGTAFKYRVVIDGVALDGQLFGDDGAIAPSIRHGRAPGGPGEVALGGKVMHRLRLHIGE